MKRQFHRLICWMCLAAALTPRPAEADPCGMVPPISIEPGAPAITRIGLQKTYVFHKNGMETLVIRPGFRGRVEEFGMLIPFPAPPALRKAPDDIFAHIAAAIDPPEVMVDLRRLPRATSNAAGPSASGALELSRRDYASEKVRVIREEAVGMYEVVVLEAGSAAALKRWMKDRKFRYPTGMDKACNEYIRAGWCFVAVKTKVAGKHGADPRAGQLQVRPGLPPGASFDGHVQAMGFRFPSKRLVVPMRLSTFNDGDLHNVVYLLTDKPSRINGIPKSFVVRQVKGRDILRNVTQPLPLRVLGARPDAINQRQRATIKLRRNPQPHNGMARDLFASDLLCAREDRLIHPYEHKEKELLRIGERLGLRGPQIDLLHYTALQEERKGAVEKALNDLKGMTLTVLDGDFPRQLLARENLTFTSHRMPSSKNNPATYNARLFKAAPPAAGGILVRGSLADWKEPVRGKLLPIEGSFEGPMGHERGRFAWLSILWTLFGVSVLFGLIYASRRREQRFPVYRDRKPWLTLLLISSLAASLVSAEDLVNRQVSTKSVQRLLREVEDSHDPGPAVKRMRQMGDAEIQLAQIVRFDNNLVRRGWAIICLADLGGKTARKELQAIRRMGLPQLVRTWVDAALIQSATDVAELSAAIGQASWRPSLNRALALRLQELAAETKGDLALVSLMSLSASYPLINSIVLEVAATRETELAEIMITSDVVNARRQAAAFLSTLAGKSASDNSRVMAAVLEQLRFPRSTKPQLPWGGGALFLPANPSKPHAKELAKELLTWWLWCEQTGNQAPINVINNNLASITQTLGGPVGRRSLLDWIRWSRETLGPATTRAIIGRVPNLSRDLRAKLGEIVESTPPRRSESTTKRASVGGKYRGLLHIVRAERDRGQYGNLYEYGFWSGSSYHGATNLKPGFWVYSYPNWYIWRERK